MLQRTCRVEKAYNWYFRLTGYIPLLLRDISDSVTSIGWSSRLQSGQLRYMFLKCSGKQYG